MKRCLLHIAVVLAAVMILAPSCRKEGPKVIPRGKLAKIYAEMLVTDQWIQNTPNVRRIADTSLVYEPILEKYGYTSEDYQMSVDHYMDDPERFSRILRSTANILDGQLKDLRRRQHQMELAAQQKREIKSIELPELEHFINAVEDFRPLDWADTLRIELDTAYFVHKITRIPYTDTIYEGVKMIVAVDTLAVKDSLAVADTLAVKDTVAAGNPARSLRPYQPEATRVLGRFKERP